MRGSAFSVAAALLLGVITTASGQFDPSPPPAASSYTDPAAALPPAPPQQPGLVLSAEETHPELKQIASQVALALTTYEANETAAEIAARLPPEAAALAGVLHHASSWSRGRIVYPQLGGILTDSASVIVVVEQMIGSPAGVSVVVRTLDIRMQRVGRAWRFEQLASAGGEALHPPHELPPEALAVLGDERIALPDTARWDIFAGRIAPHLLYLMARMAEAAPYGVVTLSTGHSWEIFGTPRQSDHSRGLAVDIYRIGDRLVIEDRARGSTTHAFVQWLYAQPEVARIGSPWALDGFGGRSFTDALHQDHIHVAVYPPPGEPAP